MAGIYIHIPFCRQMCYYCDFHFSVSLKRKEELLQALLIEIETRNDYLKNEEIETIYFGGGTPSILKINELDQILELIYKLYSVSKNPEITLEANPDDLSIDYLNGLKQIGINRLSIGIQSFEDKHLKQLNRRHDAREAINSVKNSQEAGFNNINIDLIYGLPGLTNKNWEENLRNALNLSIQHISAYHLSIEHKTVLANFLKKGKIKQLEEKESLNQFNTLVKKTEEQGFLHYEISNFSKDGYFSKHNINYWLQEKYLGIGPSAHSYDYKTRRWNISNNAKYIELINKNESYSETEILSLSEKYNDYILTSLRTVWGADLEKISREFGKGFHDECLKEAEKYIISGQITDTNNRLIISKKGKFIADKIASDLFIVD